MQSLVEGRDVVITTGTGSGKTECFLVPLIPPSSTNQRHGVRPLPVIRIGIGGITTQ